MKRPIDRFETKFDRTECCWLWRAGTGGSAGYGRFSLRSETIYAHRASWLLYNGEIPPGTCVLHKCDVPACVNPEHLYLGTMGENIADRDRRGRNGINGKGTSAPTCC